MPTLAIIPDPRETDTNANPNHDPDPGETTNWREVRALAGPLPSRAPRAIDVLDAIRAASRTLGESSARRSLPDKLVKAIDRTVAEPPKPLSARRADERIRELAPLLARSDNRKTWGLLASHSPGWTGRQCYERWAAMGKHRPQL